MYNILVNAWNIRDFQIVCYGNHPAVQTAQKELAKYIGIKDQCAGQVHIGIVQDIPALKTIADRVESEGVYIRITSKDIYVAGGNGRAVIYAAYEFLERFCGWGFYAPGVETEPVGKVNLEDTEYLFNPPWEYRMNLLPSAGEGTSHFRKRHLNARWGTIPEPEDLGGSITFATQQNCHTFYDLISPEIYFDEHPEYFAMNAEGERVLDKRIQDTQPCLSNSDVFEIVLENLKKDLRSHPNARFASVSQNDGGSFCHCDACRKVNEEEQTDGGTIYRFVNRIAEAIEDEFPNVMIDTLPYNYSTKPPVKTVMRDNVSVCLCLMVACREHSIADESCPYNEKVRKYLEDWSKVCKYIRIWDYNANFHNYPISIPNLKLLYQNVKFLRQFPVKGILFQGAHTTKPDIEFSSLWGYLQGKLAWNPDMSYAQYINCVKEFLHAYYGAGAAFIYDYLMLMLAQPSSNYHYGPAATCEQILPMRKLPDGSLDMTFIRDGNELFDLAEAVATGEQLERIRISRLHLLWYELCTTYKHVCENGTDEEVALLRKKYAFFHKTVSQWERFRICEGQSFYGTVFDFEKDPNTNIRGLF